MTLGYRSFLNVRAGENLVETAVDHMDRWMAGKEIDVSAAKSGHHAVDDNTRITIVRADDGERCLYRWRRQHLTESERGNMRRTTLTVVERPGEEGWLWTEVEPHEQRDPVLYPRFLSAPTFVRSLVGSLTCFDGRTPITVEPRWVSHASLADLMDHLADESRRGAILVASRGSRSREELERWASLATWELIGLSTMFLLDHGIERDFNDMVGRRHAVVPGTVRTYAPHVRLDAPDDPPRHRTLGMQRIQHYSAGRICQILGFAQRDRASQVPLPAGAVQADERLDHLEEHVRQQSRGGIRLVTPQSRPASDTMWSPVLQNVDAPDPVTGELRREIAHLRQKVEALSRMVGSYQRCESAILAALQALGDEMASLRKELSAAQPVEEREAPSTNGAETNGHLRLSAS